MQGQLTPLTFLNPFITTQKKKKSILNDTTFEIIVYLCTVNPSDEEFHDGLPNGVYIVNGRKVLKKE